MDNRYIITPSGELISANELYHHGIKGQKWGVRRYQNKDGSLTTKGKERYYNKNTGMSKFAGMLGYGREKYFPSGYKQDSAREVLISKGDTDTSECKTPLDPEIRVERWNHEYVNDPDSAFEKHMTKINKNHNDESGTSNNCTKVASAMCLAKMGYDYDAGRCMGGYTDALDYWFTGEEKSTWDNLGEAIVNKFSNTPNGSYGTVDLRNKNGGGHVFNWERNSKGEFNLYEGQISDGEKFSGYSPAECFGKYINKRPWFSEDSTVRVYDMTNAAPDFDAMTEDSVVRITDDAKYESKILDTITKKLYDDL